MAKNYMQFKLKFDKVVPLNSQFSMSKVWIAYAGDNRNGSNLEKEVFESAIPSLYGVPVVGEWKPQNEDFGSHGGKLEISDEGFKYIDTTKPYGFVDPSVEAKWEMKTDDDGVEREYLTANVYLWTGRYPEAEKVLEGNCNQSMEISVLDGFSREDGVFNITKTEFSALCILGEDVEPCFEGAGFETYTQKADFRTEFELMKSELQAMLNENNSNTEDFEGGEELIQEKELEVPENENLETPNEFEATGEEGKTDDNTDETFENGNENNENETPEETEVDKFKAKYLLRLEKYELSYGEIKQKLYAQLNVEEGNSQWSWITDVFDTYFEYELEDWSGDEFKVQYFKRGYSKNTDDTISIATEKEEFFHVIVNQAEKDILEEMKANYSLLQEKVATLESENSSLKEFKSEIKKSQLKAELSEKADETINEFDCFTEEEEISLKKKVFNNELSIDDLQGECFKLEGMKKHTSKKNFSKKTETNKIKIPDKSNENTNTNPYGEMIKYFK